MSPCAMEEWKRGWKRVPLTQTYLLVSSIIRTFSILSLRHSNIHTILLLDPISLSTGSHPSPIVLSGSSCQVLRPFSLSPIQFTFPSSDRIFSPLTLKRWNISIVMFFSHSLLLLSPSNSIRTERERQVSPLSLLLAFISCPFYYRVLLLLVPPFSFLLCSL